MTTCGETIPEALAEKNYSGRFMVRVPSLVHRRLAHEAADLGVSINRLASAKLALSYQPTLKETPNELESARTTWNQFEIVLAGQNIPHHKPPKFLMGTQIKHLVSGSSF